MMHQIYLDSLRNALNHHPTPKAKPSGFWSIFKCQKLQPNPYFSLEDCTMTFTSMHPVFQVSIDFCDHSSPNSIQKVHVHIQLCLPSRSCHQCPVEVAESKVARVMSWHDKNEAFSDHMAQVQTRDCTTPISCLLSLTIWKYAMLRVFTVD